MAPVAGAPEGSENREWRVRSAGERMWAFASARASRVLLCKNFCLSLNAGKRIGRHRFALAQVEDLRQTVVPVVLNFNRSGSAVGGDLN